MAKTHVDPGSFDYKGVTITVAPDASLADLLPSTVHQDSPRPDTARPANLAMREASELPHDLMGGTRQMQKRCLRWLPKEAEETETNYRIRVGRSVCFPFYKDTLCDMASRPFGQPMTWDEDPSDEWERFTRDIDGTGKDITVFARDTLLNAMHRGMEHVLVDSDGSGENAELTDNRKVYATRIDPLSMLDIRDEADENGEKHVVYCRFITTVAEEDTKNPFSQNVEVVIVELEKPIITLDNRDHPERELITKGSRKEWRFNSNTKKWFKASDEPYNPGESGIPLFTLYTQQVGAFQAEPVLEDMAWLNLAHFQSRSDHAHVMRVARLITLVLTGWRKHVAGDAQGKGKDEIVLGPLSVLENESKDARASFLEPSGKSIELSFKDQEQISDECKRGGARHMTSSTGNVTARSVTMDDIKTVNNLQTFCVRLDTFLRQIIDAFAEWTNIEAPDDMIPRTNKEFSAAGNIEQGSRALAALGDSLSKESKLREAKRYTILGPEFDIDENLKQLDKEAEDALQRMMDMEGPGDTDSFGAGVNDDRPPKKKVEKPEDE